jgi:hypothetical protein
MCEYSATGKTAGEECSSTYEGRHLTIVESELVHKSGNAGGFVIKGDPVIHSTTAGVVTVGVAFKTAAAATDLIAIDTEGIWYLTAYDLNDFGNSAIVAGQQIYINRTTAVLSKISNTITNIPFGYALGPVSNTGSGGIVAIKVHFGEDQSYVWGSAANPKIVPTTLYGFQAATSMGSGHTEGLIRYTEGHLTGTTNGHVYGTSEWINVDDTAVLTAGNIIVPADTGVYTGVAQAAARIVFGGQHMAILAGAPTTLHAWRLNTATISVTALIAAASPQSVGWVASAGGSPAQAGYIPIADIVGPGVVYVKCYSGTS